jgi:Flp pilus assembly pilin Flp
MQAIQNMVHRLVREEDGAAASEYAVLVALIVVAVAAAVALFNLGGIYQTVSTKVTNCVNGNCAGTN